MLRVSFPVAEGGEALEVAAYGGGWVGGEIWVRGEEGVGGHFGDLGYDICDIDNVGDWEMTVRRMGM